MRSGILTIKVDVKNVVNSLAAIKEKIMMAKQLLQDEILVENALVKLQ
jgi:hypothetical protein